MTICKLLHTGTKDVLGYIVAEPWEKAPYDNTYLEEYIPEITIEGQSIAPEAVTNAGSDAVTDNGN